MVGIYGRSGICNVGPTLATGKKANSRFVNVSPLSARRLSSVYLPTLGQRWLKVKKPTVFFSHVFTNMIVLVLYFSHKINIIMGTKFTELSMLLYLFNKILLHCNPELRTMQKTFSNIKFYAADNFHSWGASPTHPKKRAMYRPARMRCN